MEPRSFAGSEGKPPCVPVCGGPSFKCSKSSTFIEDQVDQTHYSPTVTTSMPPYRGKSVSRPSENICPPISSSTVLLNTDCCSPPLGDIRFLTRQWFVHRHGQTSLHPVFGLSSCAKLYGHPKHNVGFICLNSIKDTLNEKTGALFCWREVRHCTHVPDVLKE